MAHPDVGVFLLSVGLFALLGTLLIVILVCGDARCFRKTPAPFLRDYMLDTLPHVFTTRILPFACCGQSRAQRWTSFCQTAFEKYVMPLCYHLLLAGGLTLAYYQIMPRLPLIQFREPGKACPASRFFCLGALGLSFPPRTEPWIIPLYYVLSLSSWFLVYLSDAGTIDSETYQVLCRVYPYDNLLFHENASDCRTCHRGKPARSKHCSLCNKCVARFDHHCGWLASCIGLYNFRFFVLFLAFHSWMLMHGSLVSAEVVRASVQRIIRDGYVYTVTNERVTGLTLGVAYAAEPTLFALSLAFGIGSVFLFAFCMLNIYMASKGMTTNESAKWDAVRRTAQEFAEDHGKSIWVALREEARGDPFASRHLPTFGERGLPLHIYDRGYIANLAEVFFPYSYVRKAIAKKSN